MEKQNQDRSIPVRVWGMDAHGRPFSQDARAENTATQDAALCDLIHPLKPGDVIGVQHASKKARFTVIWVMEAGAQEKIQAGIRLVEGQEAPWENGGLEIGLIASTSRPPEHRKFVRHTLFFPLEIRTEDAHAAAMKTNATDVAGRGCYVESRMPMPRGTHFTVTFWIDSQKIVTGGLVRASDPGVGMGIEFTELDEADQQRLQRHLDAIDPGEGPAPDASTAS